METIHTFDIRSAVVNAVSEVFDLMLSLEIEHLEAVSQSHLYGEKILAAINLVGPTAGMVTIQVDAAYARILAGNMLGIDPTDLQNPADVKDVLTEVCNMVAGNLKSGLCDAGLYCDLSVPTLISGRDYQSGIQHADRQEYVTFFQAQNTVLLAVALKTGEPDQPGRDQAATPPVLPPDHGLFGFDIQAAVTAAVTEVFDLMLDMDVSTGAGEPAAKVGDSRLSGSISLSGDILGWVNMEFSKEFSRTIAATMLEMEPAELEDLEEIKDVIGEVCNMVAGNLKSSLCDTGFNCRISPPTFTLGSDFELECLHLDREETHVYTYAAETFRVAVGLKAAE